MSTRIHRPMGIYVGQSLSSPAVGAENLLSWVEVDEDNDLTVLSGSVAFSTMRRDAFSHVYKDFGAGHFDDFEIDFNFEITNVGPKNLAAMFTLSNQIQDAAASNTGVSLTIYGNNSNARIRLLENGVANTDDYIDGGITIARTYVKMTKVGTTYTAQLFSDAGMSVVVDTLTITGPAATYRYLYALNSWGDDSVSNADTITGDTSDLTIISAA